MSTATSGAVQLGGGRTLPPLPPGAPFYKRLWRGWQLVARAIGMLLSRLVTSLLYFVVVTPFALGARSSSDPLRLRPGPVHWTPTAPASDVEHARSGF